MTPARYGLLTWVVTAGGALVLYYLFGVEAWAGWLGGVFVGMALMWGASRP